MDDLRKGRLIAVAEREGFTREEMAHALQMTGKQIDALVSDYMWKRGRRRWWGKTRTDQNPWKIDDAVILFARENGRWPLSRDFRTANGLPSPNVARWRAGWGHDMQSRGWSGSDWVPVVPVEGFWRRMADRAKELNPALILQIPNLTARQRAVAVFGGPEAMIKKGGGRRVQQDDYGTLWRITPYTDEWMAMFVEVVNSTPEPDGTFKHYILRVPPHTLTAKEGVAWTGWFERTNIPTRSDLHMSEFAGFAAQS